MKKVLIMIAIISVGVGAWIWTMGDTAPRDLEREKEILEEYIASSDTFTLLTDGKWGVTECNASGLSEELCVSVVFDVDLETCKTLSGTADKEQTCNPVLYQDTFRDRKIEVSIAPDPNGTGYSVSLVLN